MQTVPVPQPFTREVVVNETYPVVKEVTRQVQVTVNRTVNRTVPREVTVTQQYEVVGPSFCPFSCLYLFFSIFLSSLMIVFLLSFELLSFVRRLVRYLFFRALSG